MSQSESVVGDAEIGDIIMDTWRRKPAVKTLPYSGRVIEALKRTVIVATGFAWASYFGEGVYYDYNNYFLYENKFAY